MNTRTIKTIAIHVLGLVLMLGVYAVAQHVFAADTTDCSGKLCNPLGKTTSIFALVSVILDLVLTLASIVIVIYLIWIGFQYVMARGNPTELSKLHSTFLWTLIGTAVIFSAKLLSQILQNTIDTLK